jgi:hypothetical protein
MTSERSSESSSQSSSSSSSSSSACTITETADCTRICSVSITVQSDQRTLSAAAATSCGAAVCSQVTRSACSQPLTTPTTVTSCVIATATGAASVCRAPRDEAPAVARALSKRVPLRPGANWTTLTSPETYPGGSAVAFWNDMRELCERNGPGATRAFSRRWRAVVGTVSSLFIPLGRRVVVTGNSQSWGCTTVVVISARGIYNCHLWEEPQMNDQHEFEYARQFIMDGSSRSINRPIARWGLRNLVAQGWFRSDEWIYAAVFSRTADNNPYEFKYRYQVGVLIDDLSRVLNIPDTDIHPLLYRPISDDDVRWALPYMGLLSIHYVPAEPYIDPNTAIASFVPALQIRREDDLEHTEYILPPAPPQQPPPPPPPPPPPGRRRRDNPTDSGLQQLCSAQLLPPPVDQVGKVGTVTFSALDIDVPMTDIPETGDPDSTEPETSMTQIPHSIASFLSGVVPSTTQNPPSFAASLLSGIVPTETQDPDSEASYKWGGFPTQPQDTPSFASFLSKALNTEGPTRPVAQDPPETPGPTQTPDPQSDAAFLSRAVNTQGPTPRAVDQRMSVMPALAPTSSSGAGVDTDN